MLRFSDISGRFKEKYKSAVSFGRHYFDAIKWCLAVLVLLFLPIICASLFDGFLDVSIKEQEYFRGLFYNHLVGYIKNGSFILVIIGLSGAAYIDYFFEFKFNRWETGVHFGVGFGAFVYSLFVKSTLLEYRSRIGCNSVCRKISKLE